MKDMHISKGAVMGERNGVSVPLHYGNPAAELIAVRKHILLTDYSHMGVAEIVGEGAYELLDLLVTGDVPSIRDEQSLYTTILDDDGKIVTDLYVLCDDERFILMSEWVSGSALCDMMNRILEAHQDDFEPIEAIRELNSTHGILHFEGPYSWELMAELHGMDVIGLPFQEHMHVGDDEILLRAGKHGEYSYKLLAPKERLEELWDQAVEAGEKYNMVVGGLDYQRQVRLENPCWEPTVFSDFSRCPIELQMQWTVRYDKDDFAGKDSLTERLEQGATQRIVGFMIEGENVQSIARGDTIFFGDQAIGTVITSGYSADAEGTIGRAMITTAFAYSDIDQYEVQTATGRVAIKTVAVPFVRNFSFLVNPSEHSYVDPTRAKDFLEQLEWKKQEQAKAEAQAEEKAEALALTV